MARLSSDLSEVKEFEPIPKNKYRARIHAITDEESKAKNPQLRFDFHVVGGEYDDREIRNWILRGGKGQKGQDLVPFRLAQVIDAFKLAWGCEACGVADRIVPFLKGTGDNGLEKNRYYCPDCRQPMRITYETNDWIGKEGYLFVNKEKQEGSDRERNTVEGYAPLD